MRQLIYFPEDKLAPKGGPAGYLYNLNKGLESCAHDIRFLPAEGQAITDNGILQRIVPVRLKDFRRVRNLINLPKQHASSPTPLNGYDAIHFHSTVDMYLLRDELMNYEGKVVLTSHSPCAYHLELMSRLNPRDLVTHRDDLASLETIDRYAFSRADAVVMPCPEAEEPYFNTWGAYVEVRDEGKYRYLPTGIMPCAAREGRDLVRARLGIPQDAFVVSYVGRHNEIKGYGDLREAAPQILESEDVWLLIAGKESPMAGLNHPRWIEVGWTDDPHSIIAAADVFVLPNRETFFDLVLLEALSLGQIVIASRTGGNKYFERFAENGIFLYEGQKELVSLIDRLKVCEACDLERMRRQNRSLFLREFTETVFARRYVAILEDICCA